MLFSAILFSAGALALCPNGIKDCKTLDAVPTCTADQTITVSRETCCPSCKPPVCTKDLTTLPVCSETLTRSIGSDGCPTCRYEIVKELCPKVEMCATLDAFSRDANGCPTCIRPPTEYTCTATEKPAACAAGVCPTKTADGCPSCSLEIKPCPEAADCPEGTRPQLTEKCCMSCKIPVSTLLCTDEVKVEKCRQAIADRTIRVCATGENATFDRETCCRTCLPPLPATNPVCTLEKLEACRESAPICAEGVTPQFVDRATCCPDCLPPSRQCKAEQVADCRASLQPCAAGVRPVFTDGACCGSCLAPRPACKVACAEGEICVPNLATPERDLVCKSAKEVKLRLKIADAIVRAKAEGWTREEWQAYKDELIERFCDNAARAEQCQAFKENALRARVAEVLTKCRDTDAVEAGAWCLKIKTRLENRDGKPVDEDGAVVEGATKRAATDNSGSFLTTAVASQESTGTAGYSASLVAEDPVGGAGEGTTDGALTVALSTFAAVAVAAARL